MMVYVLCGSSMLLNIFVDSKSCPNCFENKLVVKSLVVKLFLIKFGN